MDPKAEQPSNTETREAWLTADSSDVIPEKMMDEIEGGDTEGSPQTEEDS